MIHFESLGATLETWDVLKSLEMHPKNKVCLGCKRLVLRMVVDVIQLLDTLPEATWNSSRRYFRYFFAKTSHWSGALNVDGRCSKARCGKRRELRPSEPTHWPFERGLIKSQ